MRAYIAQLDKVDGAIALIVTQAKCRSTKSHSERAKERKKNGELLETHRF